MEAMLTRYFIEKVCQFHVDWSETASMQGAFVLHSGLEWSFKHSSLLAYPTYLLVKYRQDQWQSFRLEWWSMMGIRALHQRLLYYVIL